MSTLTMERSRLSFGGILRSEWIKLVTLRSTMWCYLLMIVIPIGLGLLLAATVGGGANDDGMIAANEQALWLQTVTLGVGFTQLVSVVLGTLVITGEYGTGMIRSTFAAVPTRVPALIAKAIIFGLVTFAVGLVSTVATAVLTVPLLTANGISPDFGDGNVWLGMIGAAGYLALIGLLAMAIGAIIRNSAGGIAAGLGLVLVVPTVLQIIASVTRADWAQNLAGFLPNAAGGVMFSYPVDAAAAPPAVPGMIVLEPWQGALVLVAWVAALHILAAVLLKRRDV